jgi:hypothetical protein
MLPQQESQQASLNSRVRCQSLGKMFTAKLRTHGSHVDESGQSKLRRFVAVVALRLYPASPYRGHGKLNARGLQTLI